jgi:pimeloyl-ACP methyl ester carboxylesterase
LTIGGEFGMGDAVADSFARVAQDITHARIEGAGHYPAEQRPDPVHTAVLPFLARYLGTT